MSTVAGTYVSPDHYIRGTRVGGDDTFDVISPIDQSIIARVARGTARDAELAVAAATDAFPAWAALGPEGRAEHVRRLADLIDEHIDQIAAVECLDMAMLERSLKARVIARGARNFRAYADLAVAYRERVWDSNTTHNRVIRMPSGPAAVITPWNAPFMLSTWKTAPALAAGCTVILKPPEWAPLSCSMLADLTGEAGFPPGVFNVLQGIGEEAGAALVSHAGLRRISFTGSPETGTPLPTRAACAAAASSTSIESTRKPRPAPGAPRGRKLKSMSSTRRLPMRPPHARPAAPGAPVSRSKFSPPICSSNT